MSITPTDLEVWAQALIVLEHVAPYLTPMAARLVPVPLKGWGDAIACDRACRVYFDPDRAKKVGVAVLAADVLHELLHPVSGHFERAEELGITDPAALMEWNVAADKALNGQVFALAAKHPTAIQPGGQRFNSTSDLAAIRASRWLSPLLFGQPDGLLAEEYLDLDRKEAAKNKPQPQPQQPGQKGDKSDDGKPGQPGQPQPGEPGDGDGESDTDGGADGESGQPGQPGSGGSQSIAPQSAPPGSGAGKGACGSIVGGDDSTDPVVRAAQAAAKAQHGELPGGSTGGVSPEELKSIRLEVAERVEAHEASRGRGSVPAGLVRTVAALRQPPVVDWRKRLAAVLRKGLSSTRGASDYAMTRPKWREGIATPRLMAPQGRVAVVADTSGSMGQEDLRRVLDETAGVLRSGSVEQLWWIPTDSQSPKPVPIRDLRRAHLVGGGGTDMGAGLRAAATIRPGPHLTIVLTDGDTDWPLTKPDGCGAVLVVFTRETRYPAPRWAQSVDAFRK